MSALNLGRLLGLLFAMVAALAPVNGAEPGGMLKNSTFLGGIGDDEGLRIALDADGNIYLTGRTRSQEFAGEGVEHSGGTDVFLARLSPDWSELEVVTLGGPGDDTPTAIDALDDGRVIVAGHAGRDFPTTEGVFQRDHVSGLDLFVAVFDGELEPTYVSYVGGAGNEELARADISPDGTVFMTGFTSSHSSRDDPFPTTPGAIQESHGGGTWDAFFVEFRPDATLSPAEQLVYSTYLGGSGNEFETRGSHGVARRDDGLVVLVGQTGSADFPTTGNAQQGNFRGVFDGYVTVLRPDERLSREEQLVYSTYFGGGADDATKDVTWLRSGGLAVTGWSWSSDLPGADNRHNGGNDGFVLVLDAEFSPVLTSFFGGSEFDTPTKIVEAPNGDFFICGRTGSGDFPAISAICPFRDSQDQAIFVRYRPDLGLVPEARLILSTPLGGASEHAAGRDYALDLVPLADETVLVFGLTADLEYPAFEDAIQPTFGGDRDAFLAQIDPRPPTASFTARPEFGLVPLECELEASGTSTFEGTELTEFAWGFGDGSTGEGAQVSHTFGRTPGENPDESDVCAGAGRYLVTLTAENNIGAAHSKTLDVTAALPSSPPDGWVSADVGAPRFPGAARMLTDGPSPSVALCAGGGSIRSGSPEFHFLHRSVSGDFDLSARIDVVAGAEWPAQVATGLLVRAGLDASRVNYVGIQIERTSRLESAKPLLKIRSRGSDGNGVEDIAELDEIASWLRVTRTGATFSFFTSEDGATWEAAGASAELEGPVLAGVTLFKVDRTEAFEPVGAVVSSLELTEGGGTTFRRGDSNADGGFNVADALYTLNWLFDRGLEPPCFDSADANDDGEINLADPVGALEWLFSDRPAPPPPHADCGFDPTGGDEFECESFPPCETPGG